MKNIKTSDWASVLDAKLLLVGENSTLQWKDEIIQYAMFLDYFFDRAPYDLGERSRFSEARDMFDYIKEMTNGQCRPESVYGMLFTNAALARPPKGKHILVPEKCTNDAIENIANVIKNNPTVKYVFVIGLQANYYLQKKGVYDCGDLSAEFIKGAEPRRVGLADDEPYYQPVDAKPFRKICFKAFESKRFEGVKIVPILPVKSFPLRGSELDNYGNNYESLIDYFKVNEL